MAQTSQSRFRRVIKTHIGLTKPGIVAGNLISSTGAFLLGSHGAIDWRAGALVALSIGLVVGSGCVMNNVVDKDIDALMARTRNRAMATGEISNARALLFATVLGFVGLTGLYLTTEMALPFALMVVGYIVYVGVYTLWLKRSSVHGTLAGSIAGAMPPVVAYCSASGRFDTAALALLAIYCLWQMPHSYAIAIFREADYRSQQYPCFRQSGAW